MAEETTPAAVVLSKEDIQLSFMPGETPGSAPGDDTGGDPWLGGGCVTPPIDPDRAMRAVASNGDLAAVCAAVADGAAGLEYKIVARGTTTDGWSVKEPSTWPPDVREQHNRLQVFIQAGFIGEGAKPLREGFKEQEHDRVIIGWGGVAVYRDEVADVDGVPPMPKAFGRFQSCRARFTRPSVRVTMSPVPIALQDGTVFWVEEPRHFRKIRLQSGQGRFAWYKQFGDWRAMDMKTGNYGRGARREAPTKPGLPGVYKPGKIPREGTPALEVAHWATTFPGMYPYGLSGWHSELMSVDSAAESTRLLLNYLKSGLHSVIIAASNRPFEDATAAAAIAKIDELGRGRKGLGALITIALTPQDSSKPSAPFADDATADRGRLVLHELNTKLPKEVMDGVLKEQLAGSFAHAERIPSILLGRSESYNFATASAAWTIVNRLRFKPHHEQRESFLDRILIEMGITHWRVVVSSPEWEEKEPVSGVASVAGQNAGISVNNAVKLLATVLDIDVKKVEDWWGDVPLPIVTAVLGTAEPKKMMMLLGFEEAANKMPDDPRQGIAAEAGRVAQDVGQQGGAAADRALAK